MASIVARILQGIVDAGLGKLFLTVVIGIMSWFFYRWLEDQRLKDAKEETDKKKIEDQQNIASDNKDENDKAKEDSEAINDFLKGENK